MTENLLDHEFVASARGFNDFCEHPADRIVSFCGQPRSAHRNAQDGQAVRDRFTDETVGGRPAQPCDCGGSREEEQDADGAWRQVHYAGCASAQPAATESEREATLLMLLNHWQAPIARDAERYIRAIAAERDRLAVEAGAAHEALAKAQADHDRIEGEQFAYWVQKHDAMKAERDAALGRAEKAERVVEAARPFAESFAFKRVAAMEDPGRVPCLVNTEGARALIAALAALDATAPAAAKGRP